MRKFFTLKYALLVLVMMIAGSSAFAQTNPTPQNLPFTQNFSGFTGATTVYPAGFQGWGITGSLGASFVVSAPTTDQALAGQTNAATSAYVADMAGKAGIFSTGSNLKALALALNTTAYTGITVSFTAATQRQQVANRVGELGLQYRVGTSGAFTNIAGSTYQNNALSDNITGTNSVNPATVSITLPAACENQPIVQLRWIQRDVSGAGNRPSFSVDDISINGTPAISSNANLTSLTTSAGTLAPVFNSGITSYSTSVPNSVSSVLLNFTKGDANSQVSASFNGGAYNSPLLSFPLNVGNNTIDVKVVAQDAVTTKIYSITINRAAAAVPVVTLSSALNAFGSICTNTTTAANSFSLDAVNLDGSNITIAALPGFFFSETLNGTYLNTLNFAYSGGGFTGKQIFVKFTPTAVQSYDGNITVSGGGIAGITVAAAGTGINTPATILTGTNIVGGTSATLNGSITTVGCTPVTAYGFEYSTTSGFANGTGIQVTSVNLNSGTFSKTVSGLAGATTYYYKAFATDGTGTVYGAQNSFVTSSVVPVVMLAQPLLRYTENFNDISNWTANFTSGIGANHFSGVSVNATGTIPSATRTTVATTAFSSGTSGGVQKGTGTIMLLSTGSPDNTTSAAIDFYMDFTGMNAGTLSFDWASVNNSTGDRNGSLRVYASVDGVSFTELTSADVLNFTNNVPATGTVNSIPLPAIFNNSPTARLRFYYHNGTGAGSGSRPKISIDNLTVTGVASTPCVAPASAPTSLTFGTVTETSIQGSFLAASPAVNEYLVIMSTNSSLTSLPIDGQTYTVGDNVGDGTVIDKGSDLTFTASGLTGATTYYFFVFPVNSVCTGGPLYLTTNPLNDDVTTVAGLPPCAAPVAQPTGLATVSSINAIQGSFTATAADGYLVLQSSSPSLSLTPVNGTAYSIGATLGNATVIQTGNANSFTSASLTPATQYYYFIVSYNAQACVNGPVYNVSSPLSGTATTLPLPVCVTPASQPYNIGFNASNNSVTATFNGTGSGYNYLVVMSTSPTLSGNPVDNTDYAVGNSLGGGTVVSNNTSTSFIANNLSTLTTYYFFVFSANKNCIGGTKYLTASPLTGNATTTNAPVNNIYFGNLHAHSDYSDGNKDHPGYTPADDYEFASHSLGFDFLGISEHNHFSSLDNPGNELANYHLGVAQAAAFNATHTNFLALYGMEWGVISGGGHVVVYGDGLTDLFGWESNVNGKVGPNYDIYVPKSTYLGTEGLFKTVNDYAAKNAFATLAHPNNTDFNNLSNIAYDASADSAISGVAVESGPATSTNISYSNPASPMFYLWYYQKLLSKGYHLGPTIDHDNHNTTFGRTTDARTAVIAPALSQSDIIKAVKDMHFYATEDRDAKVDFTINTRIMGSIFEDRNAPSISVNLTDATTNTSNALIRVMAGIPGSGILPVVIDSVFGSSLSYVDNSLANHATGYYYIDITNGSSRIVTSPIWYTRTCAASSEVSVTACDNYTWAGTLYTSSATATKVFTTTGGCDSTVTMHITINKSPVSASISLVGSDTGCPGAGVPLTATIADGGNGAINSYQWFKDGNAVATTGNANFTALVSGNYSVKATNANNCFVVSGNTVAATVIDNTAPVPNTPVLPVITGECSATVVTVPTATDDCTGMITGQTTDAISYTQQGTYTITWTFNDGNGNSSTQTQTVVVKDITAPVPNTPVLPVITGECSATVVTVPTATDACTGLITGQTTDATSYTQQGSYTITWTFNDGNGNSSTQTQTVIVKDITAPVLLGVPVNASVACDQIPAAAVVTASDNCDITTTVVFTEVSTQDADVNALAHYNYTITRSWTATDAVGNSNTASQTITVSDTKAPVITLPANISVSTDAGTCGALVNYTVTASDNCSPVSITYSKATGSVFAKGVTTVHVTATDISGNTASADFTVTVTDTENPVVHTQNITVALNASGVAVITPAQINNGSTDNCGVVSYSLSKSSFNCSNLGANTVILTATDAAGNSNTATATVTVTGAVQSAITVTPANSTYTGGIATNLYLGYGPQSVTLNAVASGGAPFTYAWSGNGSLNSYSAASAVFTPTVGGLYNFAVVVTNSNGCSSTSYISICVTDIRVPGSNGKVYIVHGGQTLSVSVNAVPAHMAHAGERLGSTSQTPCSGVTLNATSVTSAQASVNEVSTPEETFTVTVSPNPSINHFTLKLASRISTPVELRVMDSRGRVIDTRSKLGSNSTFQIGQAYSSGTYFAELIQGNQRKVVQLVKGKG